ncbi:DUF6461 domain-containing protein [Streptomyces hokutonensis]|uniref:DUF6461 domain-containing protein n=1 Tax=Streptomyces hokutonensis TaxID=1306990 RepID=UPI0036847E6E
MLADDLVSPNGRYRLTHSPAGETLLHTPSQSTDEDRRVWSRKAGQPGASISLGPDGVLRAGTDSTVLQRWSGHYLLDPMAFAVSAVIVRDEGDIVVLREDGTEILNSGTAPEEARIVKSERDYALRKAAEAAKPVRPYGSGMATDWFNLLDLCAPCTITWVERIDERDALLRLGAGSSTIRERTYAEVESPAYSESGEPVTGALAVAVGGWVMVIEPSGFEGVERARAMSERTQTITYHQGFDGERIFAWYRDRKPVAVYQEDDSDLLDSGAPASEGHAPGAMVPFMRQIGLSVYRPGVGDFLPPPVEIACLIAGIAPQPEHFAGEHLGAVFSTF